MIGLAYEITDISSPNQKRNSVDFPPITSAPSNFDCFAYLFNFCGLFTGPYYSYAIYSPAMTNSNVLHIPYVDECLERVFKVPGFILLCLLLKVYLPLEVDNYFA